LSMLKKFILKQRLIPLFSFTRGLGYDSLGVIYEEGDSLSNKFFLISYLYYLSPDVPSPPVPHRFNDAFRRLPCTHGRSRRRIREESRRNPAGAAWKAEADRGPS
jgi:hypothetical protein